MQLPGNGQHIRVILSERISSERMPRPKVSQINLHPPIPHPLPQHIKRPPRINLSRNPLRKLPLRRRLIPVQPNKPLPLLRLRRPNEPKKLPSINPKPSTKRPLPRSHPRRDQLFLNPSLKGVLSMRARTHIAQPPADVTSTAVSRQSDR